MQAMTDKQLYSSAASLELIVGLFLGAEATVEAWQPEGLVQPRYERWRWRRRWQRSKLKVITTIRKWLSLSKHLFRPSELKNATALLLSLFFFLILTPKPMYGLLLLLKIVALNEMTAL